MERLSSLVIGFLLSSLIGSTVAAVCDHLSGSTAATSLLDVAKSCPQLSVSCELLRSCSSGGTCTGIWLMRGHSTRKNGPSDGPERTVFLPTNEAWQAFFARHGTSLAELLDARRRAQLTELLRGHVLVAAVTPSNLVEDGDKPGRFRTASQQAERSLGVARLAGDQMALTPDGLGPPTAHTVVSDIRAGQVLVHVIDAVLEYDTDGGSTAVQQPVKAAGSGSKVESLADLDSASSSSAESRQRRRRLNQACGSAACSGGQICVGEQCVNQGVLRFTLTWPGGVDVDIVVQAPDLGTQGQNDVSWEPSSGSWGWGWGGGGAGDETHTESYVYHTTPQPGRYYVCAVVYPKSSSVPVMAGTSAAVTLAVSAPGNANASARQLTFPAVTVGAGGAPWYCDPSSAGYVGAVDWCDSQGCTQRCVNPKTRHTAVCAPGEVCRASDGACVAPCSGEVCARGQTCIRSPYASPSPSPSSTWPAGPSLVPGCVTDGKLRLTLQTNMPGYWSSSAASLAPSIKLQVQTPGLKLISADSGGERGATFQTSNPHPLAPQNVFWNSTPAVGRYHACALFRHVDTHMYYLADMENGLVTTASTGLTVYGKDNKDRTARNTSTALVTIRTPMRELQDGEFQGSCHPGREGYLGYVDWCTSKGCGPTCGSGSAKKTCQPQQVCRTADKTCVEPCGRTICRTDQTCVSYGTVVVPTCVTNGQLRISLLWTVPGADVKLLVQPPGSQYGLSGTGGGFVLDHGTKYGPYSLYWAQGTPTQGRYYICAVLEPPIEPEDSYRYGNSMMYGGPPPDFANQYFSDPHLNASALVAAPANPNPAFRAVQLPWRTLTALTEPAGASPEAEDLRRRCWEGHPGYLGSVLWG